MDTTVEELFKGWHEFFLLLGTGAATLVGLMFVAASVGTHVLDEKNRPALEIFLGPTVVHFCAVLIISILALIPSHSWFTLSGLFALVGVGGLPYSTVIAVRLMHRRYNVDTTDQLFYALLPMVGYLFVLIAAGMLYMRMVAGLVAAAASLITLLLAGIRNAWDMTLWIVLQAPVVGEPLKTHNKKGKK
jgi:hypothetical protein